MKIASLYPISPLPQQFYQPLSYFTKEDIQQYAIVEVLLNKKKVPAFVESVTPIHEQKTALKNKSYTLKKILRIITPYPPFHPELIRIAHACAVYYLEPVGSILKLFLPSFLLTSLYRRNFSERPRSRFFEKRSEVIIGSQDERFEHYKNVIRESFAKKASVALFVPTVEWAQYCARYFDDMPKDLVVLHGGMPKRSIKECEKKLFSSSPLLIIGTPLALGALSGEEEVIIIEDANSRHYIRGEHPRINLVHAITQFATTIQAKCILGKTFPSLDDLAADGKAHYLSSRLRVVPPPVLVDMTKELHETEFPLLGVETRTLLRSHFEPTLVFVSRKGFYSFIVCRDCGELAHCTRCKKPLALHSDTTRYYICHVCQRTYPVRTQCGHCGGWNLKGYGIGTERIFQEISRLVANRPCWVFDDTNIKNKTLRERTKSAFMQSKDGILVGTEMLLEEPGIRAPHVVVAAIDNLFSIPDFRINERILAILARLAEKSTMNSVLIQTRFPHHPIFRHFIDRDIKRLLERELEERKREELPPFATLIKIGVPSRDEDTLDDKVKTIMALLEPHIPNVASFPSFTQRLRGVWIRYVLITVDSKKWETEFADLKKFLCTSARDLDIAVDPLGIL